MAPLFSWQPVGKVFWFPKHSTEIWTATPPLVKGDLRLGAKICGVPAYDRDFGTIDFLILLDMREIPERYARRFLI